MAVALMLLATPAAAEETPTVSTRATARERLPNTVANVVLGIEAHGRAVAEVRTALTTGSGQLDAFLREAGAERVRTENVSVQPDMDYDPSQRRPPRIIGYTGRLSVSFEIAPDELGPVLADALTHGANTIDTTTLHPRVSEVDAAHQRLAAAATRIAMEEARAVAEAAGMKAGPARQIQVESGQAIPRPVSPAPAMFRAGAPPQSVSTESGDSEIAVSVSTTVTLLPP